MPSQRTSVSPEVERRAADLLGGISGTDVRVTARQPVAQGWSATGQDFPWLARLRLEDWPSAPSVVVKTQRPHDHWRGTDTIMRERAALLLLQQLGCTVAPRLLAAEHDVGFVVLEDLGAGPAVEDVLVGDDRPAAIRAYLAHALALADLQSATVGHADSFYERLPASVDPALDRVSVQVMPLRERWGRLRGLIAARTRRLPAPAKDDPTIRRHS